MAYATHWKSEFNDLLGVAWKIEIQEDGYASSEVSLTPTGDPLIIEWDSDGDEFNSPIHGSKATINVYSLTDFSLQTLYANEDFKYKVIISYASTTYWQGFVISGDYQEPYEEAPYRVSIVATDGLSYLKHILYDDAGTLYNGRTFESQIILDILGKIKVTSFTEYVNLYEESMNTTHDDSPFDQIKIDVDVFQYMYCYEVLQEILKKYNAIIIQKGGNIVIYRPTELGAATLYGRTFTGAETKSSTSYAPVQYINRTANASDLIQTRGGIKMVKRPVERLVINQDYGNKESWIDNYDILPESYDSGAGEFDNWTAGAGWSRTSIAGVNKGILLLNTGGTTPPSGTNYVQQSFGTYIKDCSNTIVFSFEYLTRRTTSALTGVSFYIRIKHDATNQYLKVNDEETYAWDTSAALIQVTIDVPLGISDWTTFSRTVGSIPAAGPYTITLWGLDTASACSIVYNNLRFYSTSDSVIVRRRAHKGPFPWLTRKILKLSKYIVTTIDRVEAVERQYTKTNAIEGTHIVNEYILGDVADASIDNIIEQFAGALMTYVTTLQYRVDKILLSGTSGTATVVCDGVTRTATFDTDLATTASDFVSAYAADYLTGGVVLTAVGDTLIFTSNVLGAEFTGNTTITNASGDLDGSESLFTLSHIHTIDYSTDWNTHGGSESTQLIDLIGSETLAQYARPKELIQMNIQETNATAPVLNVIGRTEDALNQYSAANRKLMFSQGRFYVRPRKWNCDLIEII